MEHHTAPIPGLAPGPDLQIVGGGLAGLVAANLAADAGLSVRLIERRRDVGGRATTADHHGYALNLGPHALYLQGQLRQALVGLGIDPPGSAPDLIGATGSIAGRVGVLPQGPASLVRSRLLSRRAKAGLAVALPRLLRTDPALLASRTVDQWLDSLTRRSDLRAMLWGLINLATYNSASHLASADAAAVQLQMTDGVRYVDGGWATIVDALTARAGRLGVDRVTARVTAVEVVTNPGSWPAPGRPGGPVGRTVVVTDDGLRRPGGHCLIAAGGPAVADRLLGLGTHHADRAGPPVEASVVDLGLRTRPPVGAHLGLDTALYATVHSVAGGLAPSGRHLVSLARYRRPGDDTDPDRTRALLLAHAREMGVDLDGVEIDRYLHRLTVTGGMPLAGRGGLAGRPDVAVPGRPGVLVAGDWVGPRGLLADAAAASAGDAVAAVVAAVAAVGPAGAANGNEVDAAGKVVPVRPRGGTGAAIPPRSSARLVGT